MNTIAAIFRKEIQDNIRDRRSFLAALIYPLLGPLMFAIMLTMVGDVVSGTEDKQVVVPVMGAEYSPRLVAYLAEHKIEVVEPPVDIKAAVQRGQWSAVLVLSPDFDRRLKEGGTVNVQVVNDASRLSAEVLAARLARLVSSYGEEIARQRLISRGVDPANLTPVKIDNVIFAARRSVGDLFLHMVPPFILFTVFIGGVYLAIDATSGERERGSLEPLMTTPVPRWHFMLGKYLAAYLFTVVALMVQLGAFSIAFLTVPPDSFSPGLGFGAGVASAVAMVALPLMTFTAALQIIIAAMTRSFKEAQTWLGLLPLLPAVPGLVMVFVPVSGQTWMMTLPVFSQTVLLGEIMRAESVSAGHVALSAIITVAAAAGLLRLAARLFEREAMIFG